MGGVQKSFGARERIIMLVPRKKIIFSANASWYLWNFRRNLMHELKSEGYDVIAMSSRDEYSDRIAAEFSFVELRNLNRGGLNPFQDIALFIEYIIKYSRLKPDLVLNLTIKPNIYSSFACRILGIPAVSTVTGLGYAFSRDNWLQQLVCALYRVAFSGVEKVMFQNPDDHALFVAKKLVRPEKTELVPGSGVDTERFCVTPLPANRPGLRFLLIARMLRDKGILQYAEAAQSVKQSFPETEFILAGPIDMKNPACVSRDEIKQWEDAGAIRYIGPVDDVPAQMAQADCVVLPSWYREGIPKGMLEAMAMTRPIITTDVPGCRSVVQDGINGFLIQPRSTTALHDAMMRMITLSYDERTAMGNAGRAMAVSQFDQNIVFDAHKKLLRDILGGA